MIHVMSQFTSVTPPGPLSVLTRGWTWFDRTLQIVVVAMSPPLFLILTVLPSPPYRFNFLYGLVETIAILAIVEIAGLEIVSVRRVDIDAAGVTFYYPFHRERGLWRDLFPGPDGPRHGGWFVGRNRRDRKGRVQIRGHRLTLEQARAILSYPLCPPWDIAPEVSAKLGLDPTSRATKLGA
jgi:hypothetical protein